MKAHFRECNVVNRTANVRELLREMGTCVIVFSDWVFADFNAAGFNYDTVMTFDYDGFSEPIGFVSASVGGLIQVPETYPDSGSIQDL